MGSTSPSAHHVQQNTHDKLLFLKLEENNTPIDRNNWLSYLQSIIGRKLATDDDKIELHSSMETGYLEAITPVNHNCSDFHPKDNQKAVYRWYDRKYSEAAWDIYSNDWELRIFEWHQAWHAAHQTALQETNPKFNTNPQLENLPLGKFFLAHPIAGFSLWRVLQACYSLDRAVCGDTDEVASWQEFVPFKYLKADKIDLKWQKEFAALTENFRENLSEKKFGYWMVDRVEEGMGTRVAMITDLLKSKENEQESVQAADPHEDDVNKIEPVPSPVYSRQGTIPPSYSSPVQANFPPEAIPMIETPKPAPEPQAPVDKPVAKGGVMLSIKKGYQKMKRKVRKSKNSKKSRSPR